MAVRVTDHQEVRDIIETDSSINMRIFIVTASRLVDMVEADDTDGCMDEDSLRLLETWLAAHGYAIRDQQYHQKKTGDASAVFQGKTGMMLSSTYWGQQAMLLDCTGYLSQLSKDAEKGGRSKASGIWLGKAPSNQVDYVDRD